MLRRQDRRMLRLAAAHSALVEALRQQLGQRRSGLQLARILADRSGGRSPRWPAPAPARPPAGRRPPTRLASACATSVRVPSPTSKRERAARDLLGQELQVLLGQHGDLAVADDVHIGAGRVEQRVLLRVAQALDRGPDLRFGGARRCCASGSRRTCSAGSGRRTSRSSDARRPLRPLTSTCSRCWPMPAMVGR